MVVIDRWGEIEQDLQQAMQVGRGEQVHAACDVGDALPCVVDGDGKMVARWRVFANDDGIAPAVRPGDDLAHVSFGVEGGECQAPASELLGRRGDGAIHIEAQGEQLAAPLAGRDLVRRQVLMECWVERRAIGIDGVGPFGGRDLLARCEARIEQTHGFQSSGSLPVVREVPGLVQDRFFPCEAEPREVGEQAFDECVAAARLIDVFDAYEKAAAEVARHMKPGQCGQRVTKVQMTVGAWCETKNRNLHVYVFRWALRNVRALQPAAFHPTFRGAGDQQFYTLAAIDGMRKRIKVRSSFRLIESEADIRAGVRSLRRKCPAIRTMHDLVGDPPLRRFAPDFEALARIVVGQQLSIASARAIWDRVTALGPVTASKFLTHETAVLAGAGLSGAKIRTLRAVSTAVADEGLDFADLVTRGDDEVRARLIGIHGIGPWTADIFVMFAIGRADAWASGDLALQVAAGRVLGLDAKPTAGELEVLAERWRPWRGVAARLLWAHYAFKPELNAAKLTPV